MTKLCKNDFSRVVPGPPGSAVTIVEFVKLRRNFFIFGQLWASFGIRDFSEKLTIFAKMSVTIVRFFTQHCALLELLQESKHFSKKDIIKTDVELKEAKNLLNPQSVAEPTYPLAVGIS